MSLQDFPSSLWRASFFDESPIPCALVANGGGFLHVNSSYCELTGYAEDELLALKWQDITHPKDIAGDLAGTKRVYEHTRDEYTMLKRYIRKDDETIWINLHVRAYSIRGQFQCFTVHAVPVVGAGASRARDDGKLEVIAKTDWVRLVVDNPWQSLSAFLAFAFILGRENFIQLIERLTQIGK